MAMAASKAAMVNSKADTVDLRAASRAATVNSRVDMANNRADMVVLKAASKVVTVNSQVDTASRSRAVTEDRHRVVHRPANRVVMVLHHHPDTRLTHPMSPIRSTSTVSDTMTGARRVCRHKLKRRNHGVEHNDTF